MKTKTDQEALFVRYLLGQCSEEEKSQLEERFFSSDEVFEDLCATEQELIDQYLRGELEPTQRHHFEKSYGSAPRQRRVTFARALNRLAASPVPVGSDAVPVTPSVPWWRLLHVWLAGQVPAVRFSLAAIGLVVGLGLSWLIWETVRLRDSLDRMQAEYQRLRESEAESRQLLETAQRQSAELADQLKQERERMMRAPAPSGVGSLMASFVLSPGLVRGTDEPTRIVVPRSVAKLQFQLDLETDLDYRSYRAELRTAGGNLIWSQDMLRARPVDWGRAISLVLPGELVSSGEHELTLRGLVEKGRLEDVGYYYFSILKR
ncbi:MAG: hypothetical protein AB1898_07280 [Acidobacteriota bacterium]